MLGSVFSTPQKKVGKEKRKSKAFLHVNPLICVSHRILVEIVVFQVAAVLVPWLDT